MTTKRGIPPVSDYAHWGEDAHAIWYLENRYDMENGYEEVEDDPDAGWDDWDDEDEDEDEDSAATTVDMAICVDCAMVHANGDWTGVEDEGRLFVEMGVDMYPRLVVGEPTGFSWSACDACRRPVAGDRFSAWSGE